jgi:hypothetical protein
MNREQARQTILSVMAEYADVPYDTLVDGGFVESYLDNAISVYDGVPPNLYSNFAAYLNAFRIEYKEELDELQTKVVLEIMNLFLSKAHGI